MNLISVMGSAPVAAFSDDVTARVKSLLKESGVEDRYLFRPVPEDPVVQLRWVAMVRQRRSKTFDVLACPVLFLDGSPHPCWEDLGTTAERCGIGETPEAAIVNAAAKLSTIEGVIE